MTQPILKTRDLTVRFGGHVAVDAVSCAFNAGELTASVGPNGAGKTTCFYMIVGLVKADEGQVTVNGKDVTRLPMHCRAREGIGYLPQEASIFRKLTVAENIMAILETRKDLNRQAREGKLESLLREPYDAIRDGCAHAGTCQICKCET